MNKKVIAVFILTLVSLVVLWAYSFGSLSEIRVTTANPASLQPVPEQTVVAQNKVAFNVYHNKDLKENFYTIKFPQTWQLQPKSPAGSYHLTFIDGSGSAQLIDVPDNSTLELFVLSQQEPRLKKSIGGYRRISYQKMMVNGNEAYQLIYRSNMNGEDYTTTRTYIAGQDQASVITLAVKQNDFATIQPLFLSIVNSFQWEKN
jgi:hypothetical protein